MSTPRIDVASLLLRIMFIGAVFALMLTAYNPPFVNQMRGGVSQMRSGYCRELDLIGEYSTSKWCGGVTSGYVGEKSYVVTVVNHNSIMSSTLDSHQPWLTRSLHFLLLYGFKIIND